MANDIFGKHKPGLDSVGFNADSVTPDDSTDLTTVPRFLYIGTAGDIKVTLKNGTAQTFVNHPVGYFYFSVTRVWSTGTTAANIKACY